MCKESFLCVFCSISTCVFRTTMSVPVFLLVLMAHLCGIGLLFLRMLFCGLLLSAGLQSRGLLMLRGFCRILQVPERGLFLLSTLRRGCSFCSGC